MARKDVQALTSVTIPIAAPVLAELVLTVSNGSKAVNKVSKTTVPNLTLISSVAKAMTGNLSVR